MLCKNIYQEKSKRKNISNSGIFAKKAHLGKGAPSLRIPFFDKCLFFFLVHFCMFFSLSGKILSHLQKAFVSSFLF